MKPFKTIDPTRYLQQNKTLPIKHEVDKTAKITNN